MSKLIFIADLIASQACQTPVKIMNMYMNRFAIDENASFEIISVETLTGHEINPSPQEKQEVSELVSELSLSFISQQTFENFKKIERAIKSSLHMAMEFENELDLKKSDWMNIHLIYAGNALNWMDVLGHNDENSIGSKGFKEVVNNFVQSALENYKINSIMLTFLDMWKHQLITQTTAKQFSEGKIKTKNGGIIESVYDDLEMFFDKVRFLNH